MVKTKKLVANCSLCNAFIEIEVPIDLAKDRDYYPFEYLDIHGNPQHAIMLFIDQYMAVRDTMVYTDLNIAKFQAKEIATLVQMSEIEALASIYNNSLRLKLFKILTDGPRFQDELLDSLKKDKSFEVQNFNLLMLPLLKMGLVKTSWLHNTFFECYFLVTDFFVVRVPSERIAEKISMLQRVNLTSDLYFKKQKEMFQKYQQLFLSKLILRVKEIQYYLELMTNEKYAKVLQLLRKDIVSLKDLPDVEDVKTLLELVSREFVVEIKVSGKKYFALLCDVKVKKFTPKYLLHNISQKLKKKEISREIAIKHLDLLHENEIK